MARLGGPYCAVETLTMFSTSMASMPEKILRRSTSSAMSLETTISASSCPRSRKVKMSWIVILDILLLVGAPGQTGSAKALVGVPGIGIADKGIAGNWAIFFGLARLDRKRYSIKKESIFYRF